MVSSIVFFVLSCFPKRAITKNQRFTFTPTRQLLTFIHDNTLAYWIRQLFTIPHFHKCLWCYMTYVVLTCRKAYLLRMDNTSSIGLELIYNCDACPSKLALPSRLPWFLSPSLRSEMWWGDYTLLNIKFHYTNISSAESTTGVWLNSFLYSVMYNNLTRKLSTFI